MSASSSGDRSRVDGFEIEIFKLVQEGATSEQWKEWLRAPLEHAAAKGNLDLFTRLMDAGADGSAGWRGCRGRTLLGAAACGNESEVMVKALLTGGAKSDVNVLFGAKHESALHVAAARGAEAASELLMMAGADPNLRDGKTAASSSPLHVAAEAGHDRVIGILVRNGAQVDAANGFQRRTPLHLAAAKGHALCISELLLGGADKDVGDSVGETPLFNAATNNHLGAVEKLLAAGSGPYIRSRFDVTPLEIAASRGHETILKAFLDNHSREVNATGFQGYAALHHAACVAGPVRDNGDAVRALLEAGADVNVKADDNGGFTPLHVAVNRRMALICTIRALLEGGADVNVVNDDGHTPLHVASMCLNVSGVELLLRWGADEMLKNQDGNTPADVTGGLSDTDLTYEDIEADTRRIRRVLSRAPADRSWRRRSWLVLSRSHPTRVNIAITSSRSSSRSGDNSDGCCANVPRICKEELNGGDMKTEDQMMSDWEDLVGRLVGLEVDGLFRLVVGFL